eukprot:821576-Amphidinium_carterae.1
MQWNSKEGNISAKAKCVAPRHAHRAFYLIVLSEPQKGRLCYQHRTSGYGRAIAHSRRSNSTRNKPKQDTGETHEMLDELPS